MPEEPTKYEKAEDVPQEERVATLNVVWTKGGQILATYPIEPHLTLKMVSVILDLLGKSALQAFRDMQESLAPPRILPAAGRLPVFDPKFLRKPGTD